jgi:hypothetical protein
MALLREEVGVAGRFVTGVVRVLIVTKTTCTGLLN